MSTNGVRASIYLRVSRDDQTTENQRLVLEKVAEHRGRSVEPKVGISDLHSTRCSRTWYGDGSMF
jgi:DNA invertase Pin-like site-specific DNA recombinase